MAVTYLERALERYPNSPLAVRGRFQLATCHKLLAEEQDRNLKAAGRSADEARDHFYAEYYRQLNLAAQTYRELINILRRRPPEKLTPEEREYLGPAIYGAAEAHFEGGQYDAALAIYDTLAANNPGRVEELYALAMMARCYWRKGDDALARSMIERVRTALRGLDDKALEREAWKRENWEKWLDWVSKPELSSPDPRSKVWGRTTP